MPAHDPDNPNMPSGQDAVEALCTALRELQVVLDTAGVGIAFIKKRAVVRCNQQFAEIYGFSRASDAIGATSRFLYQDKRAFHALGEVAAYPVMVSGAAYENEFLMRRRNGSLFWTHLKGRLVNPRDTEEGSIWIIDDIDRQKRAQTHHQSVLAQGSWPWSTNGRAGTCVRPTHRPGAKR